MILFQKLIKNEALFLTTIFILSNLGNELIFDYSKFSGNPDMSEH